MRLIEPIQGLTFAQGHWKVHVIFFICMNLFDPSELLGGHAFVSDQPWELNADGELKQEKEDGNRLLRLLAGGGAKPKVKPPP